MPKKKKTSSEKSVWRPSKMLNFIEAFSDVIKNDEFDVVILTDDELLMECNERLEEKNKVAERTFQSWKAWEVKSDEYSEFLRLYKKALANQRRELFKKLQWEESQWQKYAWIIERKFDEWNLRKVSESRVVSDIRITQEEEENINKALKDNGVI